MLPRFILLEAALAIGSVQAASKVCPVTDSQSCKTSPVGLDTCCFEYPGGALLLTQFWDTNPSTGPADSWTIHGLWPDNCDGSYEQYCDKSREVYNVTDIMKANSPCTLDYMKKYWKDYQGNDEDFWEHEWNKHGTCMSSLERKCYEEDNYKPNEEVVDYFTRTTRLFAKLPTYQWLRDAGIEPSTSKTYTLAEIVAAIKPRHGATPIVNCDKKTGELNEVWYHYNTRGSVQTGEFVAVEPVGSPSTCPAKGIKYLPKYGGSTGVPTTPTTTTLATSTSTGTSGPAPTGGPSALNGKGFLYINTPAATSGGFLIGIGAWYRAGGTPATYTAAANSDGITFTLTTSKGKCGIQADSSLLCGPAITAPSSFGYDGSFLTYEGANTFYAASLPNKQEQGVVYASQKEVSLQATWSAL